MSQTKLAVNTPKKRYCSIQSCINSKGSTTREQTFFRLVDWKFILQNHFYLNDLMCTGHRQTDAHTINGKKQLVNISKFVTFRWYANCIFNQTNLFLSSTTQDGNWKQDPYQAFSGLIRKFSSLTFSDRKYINQNFFFRPDMQSKLSPQMTRILSNTLTRNFLA